jgi:hypothetical protein
MQDHLNLIYREEEREMSRLPRGEDRSDPVQSARFWQVDASHVVGNDARVRNRPGRKEQIRRYRRSDHLVVAGRGVAGLSLDEAGEVQEWGALALLSVALVARQRLVTEPLAVAEVLSP